MLTTVLTSLRHPRGWWNWSHRGLVAVGLLLSLGACKPDRDLSNQPVPTPTPPVTPPVTPPPVDLCRPIPRPQNPFDEYYDRSLGQIHSWPLVEPVPDGRYLHVAGVQGTQPPYTFPVFTSTGQLLNTLHLTALDPSVSSRGWVAFSDLGGQIWKVKLTGDSLTHLSGPLGAFATSPRWLPDGRHLAVNRRYDTNGTYYQMVLLDEAGGTVRVLSDSRLNDSYMPDKYAFSPDSKQMVTVGGLLNQPLYALHTFDLQTKQIATLATIVPDSGQERHTGIHDITWAHTANVIFWTFGSDIYRTDVATSQTRKLVDGCINSTYEYVSAAPDASYLLASRYERRWIGGDSLLTDNSIWRIAGDGSTMTRLPPL